MAVNTAELTVRSVHHFLLRSEKVASYLWPEEKLTVGEISRRLIAGAFREHLLWQERSAT